MGTSTADGVPLRWLEADNRWTSVANPPGVPGSSLAGSPSPNAPDEYAPQVRSLPVEVRAPLW